MKICGVASGFAFGYDPTGRSVIVKVNRLNYEFPTLVSRSTRQRLNDIPIFQNRHNFLD
jgi:hypothetical protein